MKPVLQSFTTSLSISEKAKQKKLSMEKDLHHWICNKAYAISAHIQQGFCYSFVIGRGISIRLPPPGPFLVLGVLSKRRLSGYGFVLYSLQVYIKYHIHLYCLPFSLALISHDQPLKIMIPRQWWMAQWDEDLYFTRCRLCKNVPNTSVCK